MKMKNYLYFDYHATTPLDPQVLRAMEPYFRHSFGNPHSSEHAVGWAANNAIEKAKASIGDLIGADSDEIVFTSGATEANNIAIIGLARGLKKKIKRNKILISSIDHKCVFSAATHIAKGEGFELDIVPVNKFGHIQIDELKKRISEDVLMFSFVLVNNEIGSIQNMHEIRDVCEQYGVCLHSDASQAPVALDLSNTARDVGLLSLSAHKMYGPMGIGSIYIRRDIQPYIEPIVHGGGQQSGIRSGTLPLPLCIGMGEAADICKRPEANAERSRVRSLRDKFVDVLMHSNYEIHVNGPPSEERHPGNANICFEGFDAQDIIAALQPRLAISSGSACASGVTKPSHVLRAIGLSHSQAKASVRFSIGRFTLESEIFEAAHLVISALDRL